MRSTVAFIFGRKKKRTRRFFLGCSVFGEEPCADSAHTSSGLEKKKKKKSGLFHSVPCGHHWVGQLGLVLTWPCVARDLISHARAPQPRRARVAAQPRRIKNGVAGGMCIRPLRQCPEPETLLLVVVLVVVVLVPLMSSPA
jgi:hypothetical protein